MQAKQVIVSKLKSLWKDESAQGATEYILLLAIVVGIATFFGPKIKEIVTTKMQSIQGAVSGFAPENGN